MYSWAFVISVRPDVDDPTAPNRRQIWEDFHCASAAITALRLQARSPRQIGWDCVFPEQVHISFRPEGQKTIPVNALSLTFQQLQSLRDLLYATEKSQSVNRILLKDVPVGERCATLTQRGQNIKQCESINGV
jgi:hypothetical protein